MSVAAPVRAPEPPPLQAAPDAAALPRRRRAPVALALLVVASAVLQTLLAWLRATPNYFPDEYLYAELARSLAEGAGPVVRGGPADFVALLHPLVTAPAWLLDDVASGYRAAQAIQALVVSLAAVPAYALARRLRLSQRLALTCAGLAVAFPEVLYAGWIMSEPVAYTASLAAVAAAVALFDRPSLRAQALFLVFAGLAAFARVQLAAIALCYLLALLVVGAAERRPLGLLRRHWLAAGVLGGAAAVAFVDGLRGHFGYYPSFTYVHVSPQDALAGAGANALVLAYAAGWVLVPPALLGLALALARPRSTAERAFAVVTVALTASLVVQAALYGDTDHVQERYAIYALPPLAVAFALHAGRGWPLRRAHALLAAALAAVAASFPLAGLAAAGGSTHSFLLLAVRRVEELAGDPGLASLAFALGATALSALVAAVAWARPARATQAALAAVLAALVAVGAAAASLDRERRAVVRASFLPERASWVDAAGLGEASLLLAPRGSRADADTTLFWNRSVDRLLLFRDAATPDVFGGPAVTADAAGRLRAAGRAVTGPLVVDGYGSVLELRGARRVATAPTKTLWLPQGGAQLRLAFVGRYYDGWLGSGGTADAWPERPGDRVAARLELDLLAPSQGGPLALRIDLPGGARLRRVLQPGRQQRLSIPVCARGRWSASFAADALRVVDGRRVGLRASAPRLRDDPAACR